jgi:hypothetical protein
MMQQHSKLSGYGDPRFLKSNAGDEAEAPGSQGGGCFDPGEQDGSRLKQYSSYQAVTTF